MLFLSSQLALAQFTQQGPKLVGGGVVGNAAQGQSVALSVQMTVASREPVPILKARE
jgi:hypothetical protein